MTHRKRHAIVLIISVFIAAQTFAQSRPEQQPTSTIEVR